MARRSFLKSTACIAALIVNSWFAGGADAALFHTGRHVGHADRAGSVLLSPVAVVPWDDVRGDLQPKIDNDMATAIKDSLPDTQTLDERIATALSASLKVATPTAISSSETDVTGAPGSLTTAVTNSQKKNSGDVSQVADPSVPAALASSLPGLPASIGMPSASEPTMHDLVAASLYQERVLLNRYVTDAVRFDGDNVRAFVIQLQLSVMPGGRGLPYDAVTDITLHADDEQDRAKLEGGVEPAQQTCPGGGVDHMRILPMFVTDSLEGVETSRSRESTHKIGAALLAMIDGVGASAQFAHTRDALAATLGRDYNSLLTVAKLSDDTIRVRLGAEQSPSYKFAMLPRTHNIALLAYFQACDAKVFQQPEHLVTAVAYTRFQDAMSGRFVKDLPYATILSRGATEFRRRFGVPIDEQWMARLMTEAYQEDTETFSKDFIQLGLGAGRCRGETESCSRIFRIAAEPARAAIMAMGIHGSVAFSTFPLFHKPDDLLLPPQQVALATTAKGSITTTLYGGKALQPKGLSAIYTLRTGTATETVFASAISVDPNRSAVTLTFPDVAPIRTALKSADSAKAKAADAKVKAANGDDVSAIAESVSLSFDKGNVGQAGAAAVLSPVTHVDYSVIAADVPKTTAATNRYKLWVGPTNLYYGADTEGKIDLVVQDDDTKAIGALTLQVGGADVVSLTPVRGTAISADASGLHIAGTGVVELLLRNLGERAPVTFGLVDAKGANVGTPISVPASPQPEPHMAARL